MPEEINRRIIDHSSSVLLPYTDRSKENLVREGIDRSRIFVTGNPIKQVIDHYRPQIDTSDVLRRLELESEGFFLVTMHRAENVDVEPVLSGLVEALTQIHATYGVPVVCSLHPRTRSKIESFGIDIARSGLVVLEPLGFFDFVRLELEARCILTDSGTVQEEACILMRPSVTIREVTERPETLEVGSNILAGLESEAIQQAARLATEHAPSWNLPSGYEAIDVAEVVNRILLGRAPGSVGMVSLR